MASNPVGIGRYDLSMRLLHWLMAIIILGLIASGLLEDFIPPGIKKDVFSLHKSFGITALGLWLLRLWLRAKRGVPAYPASMPAADQRMAKAAILGFYVSMLLMPLSGWLMSNSKGRDVAWFGFDLPHLVGEDEFIRAITRPMHSYVGYFLLVLIAVHVLAVVKHHMKDKLPIIRRMM
jgi:cytochrome b561